jgi:hypothetical protein
MKSDYMTDQEIFSCAREIPRRERRNEIRASLRKLRGKRYELSEDDADLEEPGLGFRLGHARIRRSKFAPELF